MSLPPYIPGSIALGLTVAAALSPADAEGLSEVGFLRWAIVAIVAAGGTLGFRITSALQANTAALQALQQTIYGRGDKDHELIAEIARDSIKA